MHNKNMQILLGKPMLQYAIDYTKECKKVSRIYLSTDNKLISEYGFSKGIEVIDRPTSLGGETPLLEVYRHALTKINLENISIVVGVQPDHPDRNISLNESLKYFQSQQLDFMSSTESDGTKNGAHNIMSAKGIISGEFKKKGYIEDNCTNVHYESDLLLAKERLKKR